MGCPNDETLLAMVERSLAPGRFGEIEIHLDSCEQCRKAVAALALGSRSPSTSPVPFAGLDLSAGRALETSGSRAPITWRSRPIRTRSRSR